MHIVVAAHLQLVKLFVLTASVGRIVFGAKRPWGETRIWGETSMERNVLPWGDVSMGRNVRGEKSPDTVQSAVPSYFRQPRFQCKVHQLVRVRSDATI